MDGPSGPRPVASMKRRRVELACTQCRNRKTKCDGQRPTCSSCTRLRADCVYEATSTPQNPNRARRDIQASSLTRNERTPENVIPDIMSEDRSSSPHPSVPVDEEAAVDTLATDAFGHDAPRDTGFFGPSSNHSHFRALSGAFAQIARSRFPTKQAQLQTWERRQQVLPPRSEQPPMPYSAFDPYGMPDEGHALFLFNAFFTTVNLVIPYVNKTSLLQEYHQAKRARTSKVRRSLRVLFNVIWAHASSSLDRPESEVFYRCAVTLLDTLAIRKTSQELVQVFLLLTVFQQNHQRSVASWTYHALSVKASFQLGLHSPTSYRTYNEEDKEQRKRLWYGVLLQDRILCVSLGRPSLIPDHYNRIDPLLPSSSLSLSLDPGWDEGIMFFKHKISICSIIYSAMESLYDHNVLFDSVRLDDLVVTRTRLLLRLSEWRRSVAPFSVLKANDLADRGQPYYDLKRFDILLSVYYYRVALLLNRAVLTRFLTDFVLADDQAIQEPTWEAATSAIINDTQCAIELQGIFGVLCKNDPTFLNRYAAWWAANYSVFSTSLHLLGAMIITLRFPSLKSNVDCLAIRRALKESLDTLQVVGKTSLISWKGRNCMMKYIQGYDILVNESDMALTGSNAPEALVLSVDPVSNNSDLNQAFLPPDLMMGSMSDFITRAADDFFSQCTDMDLLQDDIGSFVH